MAGASAVLDDMAPPALQENTHVPFLCTHHGKDQAALADPVTKHKVTVARHTIEKVHDGCRVDAHVTDAQIKALEAAGYKVERLEDAEAQGKALSR
ncbi:hypothetical protein SB861_49650 [Paraburkholderia sp. SIMBA_049]